MTVIIVAVVVVTLFPVGAWALTFSNVAITDPGGVNQAKVDSLGKLQTRDTNLRTDIFGQLKVAQQYGLRALTPNAAVSFTNGYNVASGTVANQVNLNNAVFLHVNDLSGCSDATTVLELLGATPDGSTAVHMKWTITRFQKIDVSFPAAIRVDTINITRAGGSCNVIGDYELLTQSLAP